MNNASDSTERSREKTIVRTSVIDIVANVFLAAFKAVVGFMTNSIAIVPDAVNNISDAAVADVQKAFPEYQLRTALDTDYAEE